MRTQLQLQPAEFRFYHYNGNVYNLCSKHVEEHKEFAVKVEPLGSGDLNE